MEIKIFPFSLIHIKTVLGISEEQIGKYFIDQNYINFFLNNSNAHGIVAIVKKEVVGFSFFQWCTVDVLAKYIFTDKNWLKEILRKKNHDSLIPVLIGYRNLTAVKKDFQNKGVGSKLVSFSIKELKKRSDIIVNVVWKAENKKNLGQTLQRHGLKPAKTIPGYWREDSLNRKYECAVCGPPPCKCIAEIYISTTSPCGFGD